MTEQTASVVAVPFDLDALVQSAGRAVGALREVAAVLDGTSPAKARIVAVADELQARIEAAYALSCFVRAHAGGAPVQH